jgi:hypothetical protein
VSDWVARDGCVDEKLSEVNGVIAEMEHMRAVINSRWEGRGSIAVNSMSGLHGPMVVKERN